MCHPHQGVRPGPIGFMPRARPQPSPAGRCLHPPFPNGKPHFGGRSAVLLSGEPGLSPAATPTHPPSAPQLPVSASTAPVPNWACPSPSPVPAHPSRGATSTPQTPGHSIKPRAGWASLRAHPSLPIPPCREGTKLLLHQRCDRPARAGGSPATPPRGSQPLQQLPVGRGLLSAARSRCWGRPGGR